MMVKNADENLDKENSQNDKSFVPIEGKDMENFPTGDFNKMMNIYQKHLDKAQNRKDRWKTDPEYRRKRLDSMNKYSKKRYQNDEEYRERRKGHARDRWRNKKSIDTSDEYESDLSSMTSSLTLSPNNIDSP